MSIRKWSFVTASAVAMLAASAASAQTAATAAGTSVEAVVVTGSRLTSGFTAPTPVSVVGAQQLEQRAITSVGEAVQELPSFRPTGETQGVGGSFAVGQSLMDLRGLGVTRTLVLVNGQRPTPNNVNGTFDTNMLPTTLVDRTEVVTGGASAAYGADAVAGVVNFILRNRMEGFRANAQWGQSAAHDTTERQVSLGYGHAFLDDHLHFIIGGDYSKNDPSGTMYSRKWGRDEPGIISLTASRPAGIPANVITNDVQYAIAPGGLITSCAKGTTVVTNCALNGITFDANGQPKQFGFGPLVGSTLMQGPAPGGPGSGDYGYNLISGYLMKVGGERKTFLTRAEYEFTPNLSGYVSIGMGAYQVDASGNGRVRSNNQIFINRDNPYIPAAIAAQMDAQGITQLRMNRGLTELGYSNPVNTDKYKQYTIGFNGTVFGDWKWDVAASKGRSDFHFKVFDHPQLPNFYASVYAVKDAAGNIVCGSMANNPNKTFLTAAQQALVSPNCVPMNIFGVNSISKAAQDYFVPTPMNQYTVFDRDSASANISGSPIMLPAGPVSVAVGAEWHADKVVQTVDDRTQALSLVSAWFAVNPTSGGGKISAKEAYGEIGIPLLKDVPLAKALDLNAAVRHTVYALTGGVNTWKVGFTWDVVSDFRIRATRSRDIRAPNVTELFIKGNDSNGTRTNPATGVSAQLNGSTVPNPKLQPETADTLTAGVVFQPTEPLLAGLRASVDYYDIQLKGVISALSFVEVLNRYYVQHDNSVAPFITFDNSAIGFSRVDSPSLNLQSQVVRGVDTEISYSVPADLLPVPGRVTLRGLGSYLQKNETVDAAGVSLGDLAGYIPQWKWNVNVNYNNGPLNVSLQAKTSSKMRYRTDLIGPDDPRYSTTLANSVNRNVFPAIAYYSLGARYKLIDSETRHLEVYGVIDNLLNTTPPQGVWAVLNTQGSGGSGGYNPYDGVGRYFKMGVRFQY